VHYEEGVFVGYRWYDARLVEPHICFGHGLSYTSFALDDPTVSTTAPTLTDLARGETVRITVPLRNTGMRAGAEVVQCYVHDAEASVDRPVHELKAFVKLHLEAGAAGEVALELDRRAFAFWDVDRDEWTVEPGDFELRIGTSSRAIAHRVPLRVDAS
jgi:beta-glucosidase